MNDSLLLTCRAIQALAEPFRIIIHLVLACVTGACVKARPSSHDMVVCSMLRTWIARRTWRQTIERYQHCDIHVEALGSGAIPNVLVSRVTKAGRALSRRSRVRRALRAKGSAEDIRVVACQQCAHCQRMPPTLRLAPHARCHHFCMPNARAAITLPAGPARPMASNRTSSLVPDAHLPDSFCSR